MGVRISSFRVLKDYLGIAEHRVFVSDIPFRSTLYGVG